MQRKDLVLRRLPGRPDFGKQGWEVVIPRQVTLGIKECIMAFNIELAKSYPTLSLGGLVSALWMQYTNSF